VSRAARPAGPGVARLAVLVGLSAVVFPRPAAAQDYFVMSPAGDSIGFELAGLRTMLEQARILYDDLVEDPRVLYVLGFGPPATADEPEPAYPWNAVRPTSDSTVNVVTPGNLREADRAYHNYAVMRMREVRGEDPDDPCDDLVEREQAVLSNFVDGWILARTLFGGPPYAPLDELAFARRAGHLPALLAARGDASVGACTAVWAEEHPEAIEAYLAWRDEAFPELGAPAEPEEPPAAEEAPAEPEEGGT